MDKFHAKNRCSPYACKALQEIKTFEHKKCPFCSSKRIKKNRRRDNGKQQYRCGSCKRQFIRARRLNPNAFFGSATAKASKPPHSLPGCTDAASKPSVVTSPKRPRKPMACCYKLLLTSLWNHLFRPQVGRHAEYDQSAGREIQRHEAVFAVSSGLEKGR
ncbi:hypothetical protein HMPREF9080_00656 [Cardiobacterium valvarum F0432]|uniref:InsA N-terminal domain-containing protein n=1 Tax=Cardiobacterium valvarum F0432 TaxID=797473 RepID=G9ZD23_9GAMM|nr:hypothetical protein HMPREF9080_00656 [Cardiobacterium valvarum F0432]